VKTKFIVEVAVTVESDKPPTKRAVSAFVEAAIGDRIAGEPALGVVQSYRVRKVDLE
jgi:hypothetical protein